MDYTFPAAWPESGKWLENTQEKDFTKERFLVILLVVGAKRSRFALPPT